MRYLISCKTAEAVLIKKRERTYRLSINKFTN